MVEDRDSFVGKFTPNKAGTHAVLVDSILLSPYVARYRFDFLLHILHSKGEEGIGKK